MPFRLLFIVALCTCLSNAFAARPDSTQHPLSQEALKAAQGMNLEKLGEILEEQGKVLQNEAGSWQLVYNGRLIFVVTDAAHNRMRIMTPIVEEKKLKKDQYVAVLKAQFHKVLDVKYAIYNDHLWSLFIHPLQELTEAQVVDALSQVFFAAHTFGAEYQSTSLHFGSGDED